MARCPLGKRNCTVHLQQEVICPLQDPKCNWNIKRFPRREFGQQTEELSQQLQNALDALKEDAVLTETITQIKDTISSKFYEK